jgi:hypothetical protein
MDQIPVVQRGDILPVLVNEGKNTNDKTIMEARFKCAAACKTALSTNIAETSLTIEDDTSFQSVPCCVIANQHFCLSVSASFVVDS